MSTSETHLATAGVSDSPPEKTGGCMALPPQPAVAAFTVAEVGLAKKTGVSRAVLRSLRQQFTRGVDWQVCGKSINWTEAAAQRAAALMAPPNREPEQTAPAEKTAFLDSPVNGEGPLIESMQVVRWNIPNRHLIQCERADKSRVFVRVTSNQNFRERMTIRAQLDSDGWTLVGRCPRFPGRW
jgi:hypothetical protein